MRYEQEYLKEISFPLGGIGSGCIGLAGNGRLVDWEIFNRPNKNTETAGLILPCAAWMATKCWMPGSWFPMIRAFSMAEVTGSATAPISTP